MTVAASPVTPKAEPLVTLRALAAFCGSYACPLDQADRIADIFAEKEDGEIVKRRQGRKIFHGQVGFERGIARDEFEALKSGGQPTVIHGFTAEVDLVAKVIRYVPEDGGTVSVPASMADDLVRRGLAERVSSQKGGK